MNIGTITIQQSMVYCVAMKKRVGKNKLRLSGPSSPKRKNDLNKSDAQKAERIKTKIRKREKQNRTAESERCRENAKAPSLVRKTVNLVPKLRPSLPPRSKLLAELEALHDKDGIIANTEQFDCIICMSTIEIGDGVVLRDCLHQFCVDCIKNSIVYSNDAEIPCPYGNGKIRCDGIILDHEVRALVSADVYETYLNRSLRIAEATIPNTVHCKKVNCVIWCICEDNVKRFDCPNCQSQNCVPCQAIHKGLDCQKYQDNLKKNGHIQRTLQRLEEMIAKKKAMRCPKCQIVITKPSGCDFVQCAMCRTGICWATKQSRWGPKGHGDTSGGCRCGIGGKKCHPKCGYCH